MREYDVPPRFVLSLPGGQVVGNYSAHLTASGRLDHETSHYFDVLGPREHPIYLRGRLPEPISADGSLVSLATRATGVPTGAARWQAGDLALRVRPHLGLRLPDGSKAAVLVYVKETPMTQEAANVGLRILQQTVADTLPDAVPLVVDARRGRAFRMSRRTNLAKLDALIAAEAAGYVVHWRMSA